MWPQILAALLAFGCSTRDTSPPPVRAARRVVVVAPSLVEIAFALDRGDRVVGIDRFAAYPPAATRLPRVGGLVDPDLEVLLSLHPDLVVVVSDPRRIAARLRTAGVETLVLPSESLSDLDHAIAVLGTRLDAADRAAVLRLRIQAELEGVSRAVSGRPRRRMLYVFDRQPGAIRDVWAAGRKSFLDELCTIAGGENVLHAEDRGAVAVSSELLMASRPDVVFDATRDPEGLAPWRAFSQIPAVAHGRVVGSSDPIFTIPGPRVGQVARRMARALHPEVRLGP